MVFFLTTLIFTLIGAAFWGGFQFTAVQFHSAAAPDYTLKAQQEYALLATEIGELKAQVARINVLGDKLIEVAKLDPKQFPLSEHGAEIAPFLVQQTHKLNTIHQVLTKNLSESERTLTGKSQAVAGGWISSYYGKRKDPITGKKAMHKGVDIVAKEGEAVKALAAGIISFAGKKGSYGHFIEINHGNGLTTRYGHNKKLLVKSGQLVQKGEIIANLGATGKATGAHLHLEVRKDGQAVDPGLYFTDLARK